MKSIESYNHIQNAMRQQSTAKRERRQKKTTATAAMNTKRNVKRARSYIQFLHSNNNVHAVSARVANTKNARSNIKYAQIK